MDDQLGKDSATFALLKGVKMPVRTSVLIHPIPLAEQDFLSVVQVEGFQLAYSIGNLVTVRVIFLGNYEVGCRKWFFIECSILLQ